MTNGHDPVSRQPSRKSSRGHLTIPLLGLQVERRTDLLAAAAFLMALASAIAQLYYSWIGAKVELFAPEQVTLILHDYGSGQHYLRIGARMAYVNAGRPGYNATVRREAVKFNLTGRTYEQVWQSEHQFSQLGNRLTDKYLAEARPFPINAGSSVSREVYFAPHQVRCSTKETTCDPDTQYLDAKSAIDAVSSLKTLRVTFLSWVFGEDEPLSVSCTLDISDPVVDGLVLNRWAAPNCWSDKQ